MIDEIQDGLVDLVTFDSPEAVDEVTVSKFLTLKGKIYEVKRCRALGAHAGGLQQQGYGYNPYNQYGGGAEVSHPWSIQPRSQWNECRYDAILATNAIVVYVSAAATTTAAADKRILTSSLLNPQQQWVKMSPFQLGQRATLHLQMCKRDYPGGVRSPSFWTVCIVEEVDTEAVIVGTTHIVVEEEGRSPSVESSKPSKTVIV